MSLLQLIITLLVVGVLLLLVNKYGPEWVDVKVLRIINIVVIVILVLWLLSVFGLLGSLGNVQVPRVN